MSVAEVQDAVQRRRALDPSQSFIVEAPAGSGKTGLLVQRYLRLLSLVERPEAVVATTFTRKSATELKDRVLRALQEAVAQDPLESELDAYQRHTRELASCVLKNDQLRKWHLLSDSSRLQIQTIDALCASLTRQMPVLSRLGGSPSVIENAVELYRIAARRMLQRLTSGSDAERSLFRRASLHFDNDLARLEAQVTTMLAQRDQWRPMLAQGEQLDSTSALVRDFAELLVIAEERLGQVFRERSQVDFTEVTRAAIDALGTPDQPTDLLYWLDYRIQHLLVDEFQDTSRAQYDLIRALTGQWSEGDNRTLFLVGDPMQSIYRFREADVSLFLQCWQGELGSVRLTPLRLSTNFRSAPELVDWVQNAFANIAPRNDPSLGAVKLNPAQASRKKGLGKLKMHPFVGDGTAAEAERVAEICKVCLAKDQDTAILVRTRNQLVAILPALREAGIEYEAVEIDELANQQHILDLISLTRALLHLADRVSWLAVLRAPWCGLCLADLLRLVENEPKRTVLSLLGDPERLTALSPDGRVRAARVQSLLDEGVARAGRIPLRGLVEQTWLRLGGPAVLREPNQREDVETYLMLIEQLEEGGIIKDFSLLDERLKCLYAKPITTGKRIQVLTIHKAKGLEFDTVILPRLDRRSKNQDKDLLIWTETVGDDGSPALEVAALPRSGEEDEAYSRVAAILKAKQREEDSRLLYVALTRAKNNLHLLGSAKPKKSSTGKTSRTPAKVNAPVFEKVPINSHLGLIWAHVEADFNAEFARRRQTNQGSLPIPPETFLRQLSLTWRLPTLQPSVQWQPELTRAAASARKVSYEWVSDTGRHVGTVVHGFLKRIAQEGLEAWSEGHVVALQEVFESELLRLGVAQREVAQASGQIKRALATILGSKRGRWILEDHLAARSEWPLTGRLHDTLISGTVDRSFRDERGRLWIIDYKTSDHKGGSIEHFLDDELRRYRPQMETYASLVARVATGPISLGLYFPLLDSWREWEFVAEIPAGAAKHRG